MHLLELDKLPVCSMFMVPVLNYHSTTSQSPGDGPPSLCTHMDLMLFMCLFVILRYDIISS